MGLWAACIEKEGVPAYGPPFTAVGGKSPPPPPPARGPRPGQSLSRGGVYVTSVPARPCGSAGRSRRRHLPGRAWGGGRGSLCRFIPLAPLSGAMG